MWTKVERTTCNLVRVSNRKLNKFRTFVNNTNNHEIAKLIVFLELRRKKHNLITEAIFLNGQRADILDLTAGFAIEILGTETEEMCNKKTYPVFITKIKATDIIQNGYVVEV